MNPDELEDRLLDLAVCIGEIIDALPGTRLGRHVAGQLVRCGTSPAPNYAEGCASESRRDFIHKLSICLKELRETRSWLRLIGRANLLPRPHISEVQDETAQLCSILARSVITAKRRASPSSRD